MKLIHVPLYLQAPDSVDCIPTCVQMLLDHFLGKKIDLKELKKQLDYKEVGTTMYQNGSILLHHELKVTAITANPLLFPGNIWEELNTTQKVRVYIEQKMKSEQLSGNMQWVCETLTKFIDDGGEVKIKIPDFTDIRTAIDNDAIVGALNYSQPLGENEGTFHFVLVTGYDDDKVFINNPLPLSVKQGWFPTDTFLYAVYASTVGDGDNASFLVVSKAQIYPRHYYKGIKL